MSQQSAHFHELRVEFKSNIFGEISEISLINIE